MKNLNKRIKSGKAVNGCWLNLRGVLTQEITGKGVGILLFNPNDYTTYYDMGIRMIACGTDASFVP